MATRTVVVHDRCTRPNCGRVLHSLREAESGVCAPCWFREMPSDTRNAMNRLLASAFNGSNEQEKGEAVDGAMKLLRRDEGRQAASHFSHAK